MLPVLLLSAALLQAPEPTVTLIYRDRPDVTITVNEAWRRLETTQDERERVALTLALGTRATEPVIVNLSYSDFHRERFQRQPAQAPIPDN